MNSIPKSTMTFFFHSFNLVDQVIAGICVKITPQAYHGLWTGEKSTKPGIGDIRPFVFMRAASGCCSEPVHASDVSSSISPRSMANIPVEAEANSVYGDNGRKDQNNEWRSFFHLDEDDELGGKVAPEKHHCFFSYFLRSHRPRRRRCLDQHGGSRPGGSDVTGWKIEQFNTPQYSRKFTYTPG